MKNLFTQKSLCFAALLLALAPCARPAFAADDMDDSDDVKNFNDITAPLAVNYPQAIPGGLDLFHYTDYTQTHIKSGSAKDAYEMKMRKYDAKMEAERMEREAKMTPEEKERMMKRYPLAPLAYNYPQAIPGGLDLFHYTDFTGTALMEGSAMDMIEMQAKEAEKERMAMQEPSMGMNTPHMGMMGEDEMGEPFPFNYPQAIPGGLDLFHYTDYTLTHLAPGSAMDAKEMMKEKEKMSAPIPNSMDKK